jgi:TRAP-type mannitol/chloroaromatic compound transport system substrate-binding protein
MGQSASYYWKGKVPETLFFTSMPFGMTAIEQYAWFYHGDGMELMQEVYEPHNMMSFPGGNTGVQMGGWFRKEINSLEDLQGVKMRIPGFAGEVFAEVGVSPTNIPPGELYTALERNTIDAVEWVGPALDLRLGFQQIADYYYTGWHEPATELQFLVNKQVWEKLPADLQEIMRVAMRTASYNMLVMSQHENAKAWASIKNDYPNVQIKQFPEDVFQAMYNANKKLLKEASESNEQAARIVKSQEDYLAQSRAYTEISERAYLNTMGTVE